MNDVNTEARVSETTTPAPARPRVALSSREHEVISLAVKGASNKEIAHALGVAHATVRVLVSRAAAKWDVKTRAELLTVFQALRPREPAPAAPLQP